MYIGFSTIFREALSLAKPQYQQIATEVPSSTKQQDYKWLGKLMKLREWVGERQIQNLSAYNYTVKNKPFEGTVAVDREDIEDDTIGVYKPVLEELAYSAALHPDDLVFPLLAGGFTTRCYDGANFFDDNHPLDDGSVQSNLMHGILNEVNYAAARAKMMQFVDNAGKQMDIMPDLLVVPPQLEKAALETVRADKMANGASNVYYNSADVLISPRLAADATKWYLLSTKRPIKPFLFQRRQTPEFTALDKPSDENVFNNKEYKYGVYARDNAGYTLYFLAVGSDGTV